MADIDWNDIKVDVPPKKTAISIRLDIDIIDFFKNECEQYQTSINAVLRAYIDWRRSSIGRSS